jgi:hypothetical protein
VDAAVAEQRLNPSRKKKKPKRKPPVNSLSQSKQEKGLQTAPFSLGIFLLHPNTLCTFAIWKLEFSIFLKDVELV